MKEKLLKLLKTTLRWMAIVVLKKYKPTIIGITGSIGKTSAKEAVLLVLSGKFRVRKNEKNYNNEIGIPLTVIGAESGNKSIWKWMKVFMKWITLIIFPVRYPEILVLEMAVDHPGDMKYLIDFIPVKIGIVTAIASTHLEFFKSMDHIAKEKGVVLEALPENGIAVINADDERVLHMQERTKAKKIILFGFSEKAQVRASNDAFIYEENKLQGISFKLNYQGKSIPVRLPHILATHQIYAVLVAACVGIALKVNLVDIAEALEKFFTPPGRMNLIAGTNDSFIIDDTYNSSPKAVQAALDVLGKLEAVRRIAVLGDMLELGKDEEEGHRAVARKVFETDADLFFAIGERMKLAVEEMRHLGYSGEKVFWFGNPHEAGDALMKKIAKGDLVLVKGSQGMRMEKIVEKIMENPAKARNLLCRQSEEWWKKPYVKP